MADDKNLPSPAIFLSSAWRVLRPVPSVFIARGAFELFAHAFRMGLGVLVGLALLFHLAIHIDNGMGLQSWPDALAEAALQPSVVFGLGGLLFTAWTVVLSVESLVFAGMWSATRSAVLGARVLGAGGRPLGWRDVVRGALRNFPRALPVRLLVLLGEFALFAVIVGTLVVSTKAIGAWFESAIATALAWAVVLTTLTVAAVLVRLTLEFVASAMFIDDVDLGESILRAADTVVARPVFAYRLFITAFAVLIPALLVAYGAVFVQNVLVFADANGVLIAITRFGAELAILLGLAAFSVMLHGTFMSYYAWEHRRVDRHAVDQRTRPPSLEDLLPQTYLIVDIDEILGPWDPADILEPLPSQTDDQPSAGPPAGPPTAPPAGPFDLGAILRGGPDSES